MKFILLKLSTLALLVSAGVSAESTGLRGPTGAASENAASGSGDVDAALPAFFPPDLAEDRIIQLKKNGECARDCKDDFPRGDRRQDCIDDCANKRKVKQNAQCARSCADDFPRGDRRQDCVDDCDICVVDCADDFPRGDRRQDCVDDCAAGQLRDDDGAQDDGGDDWSDDWSDDHDDQYDDGYDGGHDDQYDDGYDDGYDETSSASEDNGPTGRGREVPNWDRDYDARKRQYERSRRRKRNERNSRSNDDFWDNLPYDSSSPDGGEGPAVDGGHAVAAE